MILLDVTPNVAFLPGMYAEFTSINLVDSSFLLNCAGSEEACLQFSSSFSEDAKGLGGGIYCIGDRGLVVERTIFSNNTASFEGGALYGKPAAPAITSVTGSFRRCASRLCSRLLLSSHLGLSALWQPGVSWRSGGSPAESAAFIAPLQLL